MLLLIPKVSAGITFVGVESYRIPPSFSCCFPSPLSRASYLTSSVACQHQRLRLLCLSPDGGCVLLLQRRDRALKTVQFSTFQFSSSSRPERLLWEERDGRRRQLLRHGERRRGAGGREADPDVPQELRAGAEPAGPEPAAHHGDQPEPRVPGAPQPQPQRRPHPRA